MVCFIATLVSQIQSFPFRYDFWKPGILWFTAKFGRQFTDEIHDLGIALVLGHICWILGNILECNHNFWILQDKKQKKKKKN